MSRKRRGEIVEKRGRGISTESVEDGVLSSGATKFYVLVHAFTSVMLSILDE